MADMLWTEWAGWIFTLMGSFVLIVGGLGILRLPDVYTRLHASGVTDTLAAGMIIIGLMFASGLTLVTVKLILIIMLLWMTSPVASHSLAQSALFSGIKPKLHENRVHGASLKRFPYAADALRDDQPGDAPADTDNQRGADQ